MKRKRERERKRESESIGFSLPMQNDYHAQSVVSDPFGNVSESFRGLWRSSSFLCPMFTSQLHSCACAVLCCACFQELEQRYLLEKAALPPYSPLLLSHLILPHGVLSPIIFVCYYQWSLADFTIIWQSVFDTY